MGVRFGIWAATTAAMMAATAASAAPSAPAATAQTPRAVVDRVARLIEDDYVHPDQARRIAADLRQAAKAGAFDKLTDNGDLATALTARLKPIDAHFNVAWRPPEPAAQEPPRPMMGGPSLERRRGYGFRRVEILPGNIGYVDLRMFADFEKADAPAKRAADAAMAQVADTDAVIIDLRDNGGGAPNMVGYLVSWFTPPGADIYNTFHERAGAGVEISKETPPLDNPGPRRLTVPLYVLVSARTGSAAESFAYTLQTARRATIVGETSAGAANPGQPYDAGGGFLVFISSGEPINPITKTNWERVGVRPDVAAPSAQALDRAQALALEAVLKTAPADETADARWALEALRATARPPTGLALGDYVGAFPPLSLTTEDGKLLLHNGRRPVLTLAPLGVDAFTVEGEPTRRLTFARDGQGRVVAAKLETSDGSVSRFKRGD